jgi:hypothetical protein
MLYKKLKADALEAGNIALTEGLYIRGGGGAREDHEKRERIFTGIIGTGILAKRFWLAAPH